MVQRSSGPRVADRVQPIVQFLAAFPANLFFPVAVVLILHFGLSPEIWLSPLMILGTQWYIGRALCSRLTT